MISSINEARRMFVNNTSKPRCLVVLDSIQHPVELTLTVFDLGGWAVTWLDVHTPVDTTVIATLEAVISATDMVYLIVGKPTPLFMDIGYVFGITKQLHKPVFIDYRGNAERDDYPICFRMADGIGFGVYDMSLFIDTFESYTELSDPSTRARAVANQIKRLRMN